MILVKNSAITRSLPLISLLGFVLGMQACRAPEKDETELPQAIRVSWPDTDREASTDMGLPPFELKEETIEGSGRFNNVFWLDFEGARVSATDSFIVKDAGLKDVLIPAFSPADIGSDAKLEQLKEDIRKDIGLLFPGVDIKFTLKRPAAETFSRVHIGGDNFTGRPRVLGIAPLDLGNRSGDDILFVYPKVLGDKGNPDATQIQLTHAIAHEIAHSLGARHIDNQRALMKTSVALEADSFNLAGPVVESPAEVENSLDILLHSVGSISTNNATQALPEIVDLDAFSSGGIIQYTVISQKNILQNHNHSLAKFRYAWEFEGKRSEGTSVLMTFSDRGDHILNLTVSNDSGASRKFQFLVGHRR